jgi:hypothetical protein
MGSRLLLYCLLNLLFITLLALPGYGQQKPVSPPDERGLKLGTEQDSVKMLPARNKRWALIIGVDDY